MASSHQIIYRKMLRWQLLVTFVVATLAWVLASFNASYSVLLGGMSVVVGGAIASKMASSTPENKSPAEILIRLLKAEVSKIVVIATILYVGFKIFAAALVPLAVIAGLAASALMSGAAMYELKEEIKL